MHLKVRAFTSLGGIATDRATELNWLTVIYPAL